MDSIQLLLELVIHLDKHLTVFILNFGGWTYLVLFLIIFCETGLVVTPFLPGDSLIFTAGAVAAATLSLKIEWLILVFWLAALTGDSTNYWIGYLLRSKVLRGKRIPLVKKTHVERTQLFFRRHGGKTVVLARFIPIIRTFAPFIAGVGEMTYWRFLFYSFFGSMAWILIFTYGGYFFGNLPFVKAHFMIIIFAIVFVSLLPALIELFNHYFQALKSQPPKNIKFGSGKKQK